MRACVSPAMVGCVCCRHAVHFLSSSIVSRRLDHTQPRCGGPGLLACLLACLLAAVDLVFTTYSRCVYDDGGVYLFRV